MGRTSAIVETIDYVLPHDRISTILLTDQGQILKNRLIVPQSGAEEKLNYPGEFEILKGVNHNAWVSDVYQGDVQAASTEVSRIVSNMPGLING